MTHEVHPDTNTELPVKVKEEGEKDERFTDKALFDFITDSRKPFNVVNVRALLQEYYKEEITQSRLVEKMNEIVYYFIKKYDK